MEQTVHQVIVLVLRRFEEGYITVDEANELARQIAAALRKEDYFVVKAAE